MSKKELKEFADFLDSKKTEENASLIESISDHFVTLVEQDMLNGAEAPEMPANTQVKNILITELNGDLAREYAAAIQYIQHAAVMTGPEYMSIMKEMLVHADEEMSHAKTLSDRINYLGGIPTTEVTEIKISNDAREMITQDKTGEEEAIGRYKQRIKQAAQLGDLTTKKMLMEILSDEEEHRSDLMLALGE